ncbi:MAG: S4 domain-containing protein [Gammaproteobacteria bacterium]|nr:S4 domain-containing protein [Gammaproteobacteria bacterium]MYB37473.1 RNA-binding protein [Gammaproteobacteria bacterium]
MRSRPTIAEASEDSAQPAEKARVDRWLWAARFFKTRTLAKAAVEGGKAHVNGARVKAARSIQAGDTLTISRGHEEREVIVTAVATRRGSATEAAKLYRETAESVERRTENDARRRMERAGLKVPRTRPTTRQRRQLAELKQR